MRTGALDALCPMRARVALVVLCAVHGMAALALCVAKLPVWLVAGSLVVLVLTPVESPDVAGWWIPAWLFAGYELILGDTDAAGRALFNFSIAAIVMLLVWILDLVRYRLVRK